jgi:hypothetical protein
MLTPHASVRNDDNSVDFLRVPVGMRAHVDVIVYVSVLAATWKAVIITEQQPVQ